MWIGSCKVQLEVAFMKLNLTGSTNVIRWGGRFALVTLAVALAGCSPEGTGSIKIADPQAVRDKFTGGAPTTKPANEKQAKALAAEEEAAKKHPKLR
jgi:hypothetical protein